MYIYIYTYVCVYQCERISVGTGLLRTNVLQTATVITTMHLTQERAILSKFIAVYESI